MYVFYVFFQNPKKHDFLRFFELPHTFSRTLADTTDFGSLSRFRNSLDRIDFTSFLTVDYKSYMWPTDQFTQNVHGVSRC